MVKRIILLAAAMAILILGGAGCMRVFPQSDEAVRDEMLSHLYEKYGVEFIAISLDRGSSDTLYCYPISGDPDEDRVRIERITQPSGKEYKDTYFGIIIREDIEAEITALFANVDMPINVMYHFTSMYFSENFDKTKNYQDLKRWIADGNPWRFTITITLPSGNGDDQKRVANSFFELLHASSYNGLAYICFLPNEAFACATRATLNSLIAQYDEQTTVFSESIN